MSDRTARLALPFIAPGQAQKEVYHNEALTRLDLAVHASVEGKASAPPLDPVEGQCWIVSEPATGAWAGKQDEIAGWTQGGWRFLRPFHGLAVHNKISGLPERWLGSAWSGGEVAASALVVGGKKVVGERQPAVPSPSGGTNIDAEARSAITAITATLKSHGLID